jgi:hypothetical protein
VDNITVGTGNLINGDHYALEINSGISAGIAIIPSSGFASLEFVPEKNWSRSTGFVQTSMAASLRGLQFYSASAGDGMIVPALDNSYDLGTSSNRWKSVYATTINTTNIIGSNPIITSSAGPGGYIQLKSLPGNSLWLQLEQGDNDSRRMGFMTYTPDYPGLAFFATTAGDQNIRPYTDQASDLGTSSIRWRNVYSAFYQSVNGELRFDSEASNLTAYFETVDGSNGYVTVNLRPETNTSREVGFRAYPKYTGATGMGFVADAGEQKFFPDSDNAYSLGTASNRWANVYAAVVNTTSIVTPAATPLYVGAVGKLGRVGIYGGNDYVGLGSNNDGYALMLSGGVIDDVNPLADNDMGASIWLGGNARGDANLGDVIFLMNGIENLRIDSATRNILPGSDNVQSFGDSTHRWAKTYSATYYFDATHYLHLTGNKLYYYNSTADNLVSN